MKSKRTVQHMPDSTTKQRQQLTVTVLHLKHHKKIMRHIKFHKRMESNFSYVTSWLC
jgi:hypothetical protein